MSKPLWSAEEIQTELQTRVNKIREIIEDSAVINIPSPYWHEMDDSGTNWDINVIPNARAYISQIIPLIAELRSTVNLKT